MTEDALRPMYTTKTCYKPLLELHASRHVSVHKPTFHFPQQRENLVTDASDKAPAVEAPGGGKGKDKKGAGAKEKGGKAAAGARKSEDNTASSADKKNESYGDPRHVSDTNCWFLQC